MKKRLRFSMPHTPLKKLRSDVTSVDYERYDVFHYSTSEEESDAESDIMTSDCVREYDGADYDVINDYDERMSGSSFGYESINLECDKKRQSSSQCNRSRTSLKFRRSDSGESEINRGLVTNKVAHITEDDETMNDNGW